MPLCEPKVLGPLSELSRSVRVQGQLPGATVTIMSLVPKARVVTTGTATSGDDRFQLKASEQLIAGDLIVALQERGGERTEPVTGDLGIAVQPRPASPGDIGTVGLRTHPFACGRHVLVEGAIPGATVHVDDSPGPSATATADEGQARVTLPAQLLDGSSIAVYQEVSGLPPGPQVVRPVDRLPGKAGEPLAAPVIGEPLRGCDPSIDVSQAFDGADVELDRASGVQETFPFFLSQHRCVLGKELSQGDRIRVKQSVDMHCERPATWSPEVVVGPIGVVDAPVVVGPLCAGSTRVQVSGLRPGAFLHLVIGPKVFDGQVPPDTDSFDFGVPPLPATFVTATQEVCGVLSPPSDAASVDPAPDQIPPAIIAGSLYECARSVGVEHAHPGATVQVWARHSGVDTAISNLVTLPFTAADLAVAPLLRKGDDVYVKQWACSARSSSSPSVNVQPEPPLATLRMLDPIYEGDQTVQVIGATPGALVEVYTSGADGVQAFCGSAIAGSASSVVVNLAAPLAGRIQVAAEQFLCADSSGRGRPMDVRARPACRPRPFYVVGHNPNSLAEVAVALAEGANAIEPDVNIYEDDPGRLCISHDMGGSGTESIETFLDGLHALAIQFPALALVVFDCKSHIATPPHGEALLREVRNRLTYDLDVNVILSVAKFSDTPLFEWIARTLRPREGVMIDEQNDALQVSNHLLKMGATNHGFGDGITDLGLLGPNVRPAMELACALRAGRGRPPFIYVWTLNDYDQTREYIDIGIDGVISDAFPISSLPDVLNAVSDSSGDIRLATRADDPFRPANCAYGLTIHTGDVKGAGTDANITFTLTGTSGATASKTIDAAIGDRMERNTWDYVTIYSVDIGELASVTVERDSTGLYPDWYLDQIRVDSSRFGAHKTALFDCLIDTGDPFTRALT